MATTQRQPIAIIEGEVATKALLSDHPRLYHYTDAGGLRGIVQSNTLWATHFADLNDSTEVVHLRSPLEKALFKRFLETLRSKKRQSLKVSRALQKFGGLVASAQSLSKDLVDLLYRITFEDGEFEFGIPFITSFCSHSSDNAYEHENGLLSQWRGYGGQGGFCVVLDTTKLSELLMQEANAFNWTHLNLDAVTYATDNLDLRDMFRGFLDPWDSFVENIIDTGSHPGWRPFLVPLSLALLCPNIKAFEKSGK